MVRTFADWMSRYVHRSSGLRWSRRKKGQALVELALSVTFLSYLFSAAVDLGFAYKSYQTLLNATAEASSYLTVQPAIACTNCTPEQAREQADREARVRFRGEQGNRMRAFGGSTMDLNGDGKDDETNVPSGYGNFEAFIQAKVRIDVADSSQIDLSSADFGVDGTFTGSSDTNCQQRRRFSLTGGQCYIVIRSETIYKPFALAPALGSTMTIRAISVKPIVQ